MVNQSALNGWKSPTWFYRAQFPMLHQTDMFHFHFNYDSYNSACSAVITSFVCRSWKMKENKILTFGGSIKDGACGKEAQPFPYMEFHTISIEAWKIKQQNSLANQSRQTYSSLSGLIFFHCTKAMKQQRK